MMNKVFKDYFYFQFVSVCLLMYKKKRKKKTGQRKTETLHFKSSSDKTKHSFPHSTSSIKTIKQRPTYREGNFPRNICMFSFAVGLMASTLWACISVMDETLTV